MGKKITANVIKKPNGISNNQHVASGVESYRNGTRDDEIEELTERLRRLEASQSHGHTGSDVYKFVLFFIMGVVMTVFLYPHAAKTIESLGTSQQSVKYEFEKEKSNSESFVDVDEKQVDRNYGNVDIINRSILHNDSDYNEDELVRDIVHEKLEDDVKTETYDKRNEQVNVESDKDTMIDRKEDPLVGEDVLEGNGEGNKVQGGERVELFSMDGDEGELPVTFIDAEGNEVINPGKTGSGIPKNKQKDKNKKSKKSSGDKFKATNKPPKKTTGSDKRKKDEEKQSVDSSKLLDEIKNFKPTYQKNITPKKIFADGRRIPPMELLPQKPNNSSVKVWMFEEFLSEAECDGLMRVHNQHVKDQSKLGPILCFDSIGTLRKHLENVGKSYVKVSPNDFTEGTTCVNATFSTKLKTWLKGNWSYSTAFYPGESRFASIFEDRVQQAMGLRPENGGKFQITSYPLGIGYKSHADCTESTDKRDRVATVLVYLDTVDEGGETDFPELGIWVRPRKARALLWNNMNEVGDCEPMSIHQAKKVENGHKVILQRWYYYQSFYSLGKRPPEPPLPKRVSGQPRVSCDEYEYGSCRWYDEWNFEHMLEYERQKYNLI